MKQQLSILLIALFFSSCGPGKSNTSAIPNPPKVVPLSGPEAAWLVGTWESEDSWSNSEKKRLVVSDSPKGVVFERMNAQVGSDEIAELPFPTVCSFRYSVSRFFVKQDEQDLSKLTIVSKVDRIELLDVVWNSENCINFKIAEESKIGDSVTFVLDVSRLGGETLNQDGTVLRKVGLDPTKSQI